MEVKFNKRDYLDSEFLDKIFDKYIVFENDKRKQGFKKVNLSYIIGQIEHGNTTVITKPVWCPDAWANLPSQILNLEPFYKRYYLEKYIDVFSAIPEIIDEINYHYIRSPEAKPFDVIKKYSLQELQEIVFQYRVLPLHQLFGHYLGNYILETHIAKYL